MIDTFARANPEPIECPLRGRLLGITSRRRIESAVARANAETAGDILRVSNAIVWLLERSRA